MDLPDSNAVKNVNIAKSELEKQHEYSEMVRTVLSSRYEPKAPLAFVHTYGCQQNVADSERIKGMLSEMGYGFTDSVDEAELVLYNTCAVREHAEDRVFGNVGALKHNKRRNPNMIVALCGCMMQQEHIAEKIKKSYPFVDLVFGTHVIYQLPELMYKALCSGKRVFEIEDKNDGIAEGLPTVRDGGAKAWLSIMYGCNNFCTYCIVPYVRGRERSREPQAVLEEARSLVESGYKDITLLGQNVNSYGKGLSEPINFAGLLRRISGIDGDFRIRFMTSHPKDCTHELLDTMASSDKISKHLHLPFQSGSNRVLKAMNRRYTREQYLDLVKYAREAMPDLSITSDVIVGFPGETYDEFKETLSLVEEVRFTSLFTFIYSPRRGTPAAEMPDEITHEEKSRWFKELTDLQEKIAAERTASMKGKTYRVLAEGKGKLGQGYISGRTDDNIIIEFKAPPEIIGEFCMVNVTEPKTWIVIGELMK